MAVLLLYFLGMAQGRSELEAGAGPGLMLVVHVGFALLALTLLQWERVSKRWKARHAKA